MNTQNITLVSLIGRPLSGKDHQAKLLAKKYQGVAVISTGGLLRDQALLRRSGYLEDEIRLINFRRDNGMSVRAGIVEHLAHQAILEHVAEGNTMIVLAGHPRSHRQL